MERSGAYGVAIYTDSEYVSAKNRNHIYYNIEIDMESKSIIQNQACRKNCTRYRAENS